MKSKKHIWCIAGTRPEVIKLAPVIKALSASKRFIVKTITTAQHRELADTMFSLFRIKPDYDLDVMKKRQTLTGILSAVSVGLSGLLEKTRRPEWIIVQGDTTTAAAAALFGYYNKIKVAHVEAGLRTHNLQEPYPEEGNRQIIGRVAQLHFAPTNEAKNNLLKEGIEAGKIHVTANTVVDALKSIVATQKIRRLSDTNKNVLVTCHRRESFGKPLSNILGAIKDIAKRNDNVTITFPVHPNPNVLGPVHAALDGIPNISLVKPLNYIEFIRHMVQASLIISDSGGVQEEATALGRRVLVLRRVTERPEAVKAGYCKLVGANRRLIVKSAEAILKRGEAVSKSNIYGVGRAGEKIATIIR